MNCLQKPVAFHLMHMLNENLCFFFFPGKMSNIRAVRKRQQLNNLVAMVTELARPGYTVVDFCSGTVREFSRQSSAACIFITAPEYDCIRLLPH